VPLRDALPLLGVKWTPPPQLWMLIVLVAGFGAVIVVVELCSAALSLVTRRHAQRRAQRRVLRIRTPNPQITQGTTGLNTPNGTELWYAANQLQRAGDGPGGWLSTTLGAAPDEPVAFHAVIGNNGRSKRAEETLDRAAAALRQIIIGANSEAEVQITPDPLETAIQQATSPDSRAVLVWREYLLLHSPAYPLRTPADADSDLMAQLVAAIRPRTGAVRYAEVQIAAQMRHDWRMDDRSWRAAAHRRLGTMRGKTYGGFLSGDGRALEQKLDGPAADTTLRVVVLAEHPRHARSLLQDVTAALGTYARRSGHVQQRWTVAASGKLPLSRLPADSRPHTRTIQTLGASLFFAAILVVLGEPLLALALALAVLSVEYHLQGIPARKQLTRLLARAPRLAPPQLWLAAVPMWRAPAVLSAGELGGLWHLPSPNLGTLARWLPSRLIPPPREAFIDSSTITTPTGQRSPRITFGHAVRSDGQLAPVGPSLYDIRNIFSGTAGMGGGKSQFLANFSKQVIPHGFVLIDGKGDDEGNLTNTVRRYIPLHDEGRLVILNFGDTDWPVSLNPLAGISADTPGAIDQLAATMQSIFARLDPEGWSSAPGMQQFLEMGTRLVVETVAHPTVLHVKQCLLDEGYRTKLLEGCKKIDVKTFWTVVYPSSSEQQKTSLNALMRRFDKLVLSDVVRLLMAQELPTFQFGQAITEKLIVLCPIPHVRYGPLASTAAMLLFQSVLRAAFERPGSAATREDYPLIIDEFQVLVENGATQDVATAVTQLRSLGIPTLYVHQGMSQIGDLQSLMLINAENRAIFRTQEPDASLYARQYAAAGLTGADIASQEPREHIYVRFPVAGKPCGPFSAVPLPWPQPLTILLEPYDGPHWQRVRPPPPSLLALPGPVDEELGEMVRTYDERLLKLCYQEPYTDDLAMAMAETLSDDEWMLMQARWAQIAQAQRQYILDNPGCIPDREERQTWLSRLGYARPRLLAEIETFRVRRASGELVITPPSRSGQQAGTRTGQRPGTRTGQQAGTAALPKDAPNPEPPERWATNANQPPPPNDDPTNVQPSVRA
ncbi:MAG: hypothetical protein RLZZ387_2528, partial [Chloroflexota bacterium]